MRRLLVFTENYSRGGGNRYMVDLINGVHADFDQIVLASNSDGLFPEDIRRLPTQIGRRHISFITRTRIGNALRSRPQRLNKILLRILIFLDPLFFFYNLAAFIFLIKKLNPSYVLSCNGGYPGGQACLAMVVASKISRIPAALSIVSMPARRRTYFRHYEQFIDKLVWYATDIVIVNAKAIADALGELRQLPSSTSAKVIYNGVEDLAPYTSGKKNNGRFVIGCVARMDKAKGVLLLLDAFAHLARTHSMIDLVLAGQGDASAELAHRIDTFGLNDRVLLLGHYEGDIRALLGTFDLYILPSFWEGFPYSVIEAMRSGCTIIATKVGGIPEAITDGQEGMLIDPRSKNAIVESMQRLLDDSATRQLLARNARLKYEKEFSLQKMHERLRGLLVAKPS